MSMAGPPSTVGPSASISETTIPRKKVDFSISHYTAETTNDLSQKDMQIRDMPTTQIEDRPTVIPRSTTTVVSTVDSLQQKDTLRPDGGGQIHDVTSLEGIWILQLHTVISTMESTLIFSYRCLINHI